MLENRALRISDIHPISILYFFIICMSQKDISTKMAKYFNTMPYINKLLELVQYLYYAKS